MFIAILGATYLNLLLLKNTTKNIVAGQQIQTMYLKDFVLSQLKPDYKQISTLTKSKTRIFFKNPEARTVIRISGAIYLTCSLRKNYKQKYKSQGFSAATYITESLPKEYAQHIKRPPVLKQAQFDPHSNTHK